MKTFIEIGSNAYDTLIPLWADGWKGIIIEPAPAVFKKLVTIHENSDYPKDNLILVNAAIAEETGFVDFYFQYEADGWSSLLPDHYRRNPDLSKPDQITVSALSFDALIERNKEFLFSDDTQRIDLLKIDAEGYDARIIRTIDFQVHNIRTIVFEYTHLMHIEVLNVCKHLHRGGYHLVDIHESNLTFEK